MTIETKGIIFDIQGSSFVDGPGIRTTVFFKGCNLKCKWCHNPESQSFKREMMVHRNKCISCGTCVDICPNHMQTCTLCGSCVEACPHEAREICGREMLVSEVFEEILRDKAFYQSSGGGVTFSGGECMLQLDFLYELLMRCRDSNIHTAVDTAGNVPWSSFEKVLPFTDLFLFDIKAITPELHKKYTGVDNSLLLNNLVSLLNHEAEVWIRIPVIHGVNDTEEEMLKFKKYLSKKKVERVELLPYHAMGDHKYIALGRDYNSFSAPSKEEIDKLRDFLKAY